MEEMTEVTPLIGSNKHEILNNGQGLGLLASIAYIISIFGVPPIVALPGAIEYCGLFGFALVTVLLIVEAYTAVLLGKTWLLLENNWPKEATYFSKYPYPALAQRVGGPIFRKAVNIIQDLALFGAAVPFLLLASENVQSVISAITNRQVEFSFCYVLVCTALVITPFLWIGTPKDLRHVSWAGAISVVSVSLLVMYLLFTEAPNSSQPAKSFSSWTPLAYCFGVVAFQFDIHPMILTLQMDMKNKSQLPVAVMMAFGFAFLLFGIVSTGAFFLFGDSLEANLLNNFRGSRILYITRGIVGVQSLICLALGINTLFQDLEDTFGIQNTFGWRRVILRTFVMILVLFVSESIPFFAIALELVGGLLITPFVFIFPPLFYIVIKNQAEGVIKVMDIIIAAEIIALGIIGCISATVESGMQIAKLPEFAPPCYSL